MSMTGSVFPSIKYTTHHAIHVIYGHIRLFLFTNKPKCKNQFQIQSFLLFWEKTFLVSIQTSYIIYHTNWIDHLGQDCISEQE